MPQVVSGIEPRQVVTQGTYEVLSGEVERSQRHCIVPTSSPNLDVLPTNLDLVGAEIELVHADQPGTKTACTHWKASVTNTISSSWIAPPVLVC